MFVVVYYYSLLTKHDTLQADHFFDKSPNLFSNLQQQWQAIR